MRLVQQIIRFLEKTPRIQRENLNAMEEAQALERLILEFELTHQEVAEAVSWLLSEQSSYTTGHLLPIDGGYTCA